MWDRFFHLALHLGWFLQQSCDALGGSTQEEFHVSSTACSQHTSIYTALSSLKTEHLKKHWGTSPHTQNVICHPDLLPRWGQ